MNISSRFRSLFVCAPLAAGLLAACAADTAPPSGDGPNADELEIVRGVPDREDHPAVVAIDVGEQGLCTGTLIAPDVVLTARHCVSRTAEQVQCPPGGKQVLGARTPSSLRILVGDDASGAEERARGREVLVPKGDALCDADIAVILLDDAIDDIEPIRVRDHGVAKGDHVTSVGFGRAGDNQPAGAKLLREHVRVLATTDTEFQVGEATCAGDSGGPALDEETDEVVGVVSRGAPTCDGKGAHNVYTRADAFLALVHEGLSKSLAPEVDGSGPPRDGGAADGGHHKKHHKDAGSKKKHPKGASDLGADCKKAGDCAAGVCVSEGSKQYCSRKCDAHDHCPQHFHCQKSKQGDSVCVEK